MKNLSILIDDELRKQIRIKLAEEDMTLKAYIEGLILKDLEKTKSTK